MNNIIHRVILFSVIAVSGFAYGQDERADWLKENAVTVRSIVPNDGDFRDLLPLKELIGDARVVALGEQTHGDGATFHAKTRLIKFLHEEMGFDVLVWESGMFDCWYVNYKLKQGKSMKEAWTEGVFAIWGMSEQVQPLFEYIDTTRKTDRPLEIAGMDAQLTGNNTVYVFAEFLKAIANEVEQPTELKQAFADLDLVLEEMRKRPPVIGKDRLQSSSNAIETICSELKGGNSAFASLIKDRDRKLVMQKLRNFATTVEMMYWMGRMQAEPEKAREYQQKVALTREPAMSQSLIFLANEYYADRKLIVWAASSHLTYNSETVEMRGEDGEFKLDDAKWKPMGNAVHEALGDDLYVIDFIANSGTKGSAFGRPSELQPAEAGSMDAICSATGEPYLFVDLRTLPDKEGGSWLRDRLVARPRGYSPMRTVWPNVCDAFFFTDKMYPSTRVAN